MILNEGCHQPCMHALQTGMDKRLRTLVDLEALLNDGTAYTLFFVLKGFAEGSPLSAADTIKCAAAQAPSMPSNKVITLACMLWLPRASGRHWSQCPTRMHACWQACAAHTSSKAYERR